MRWMAWMCALAMAGCGDDDGPTVDGGVDAAMVDGGDRDGGVEGDAGDEDAGTPSALCPAGDAILDPVSGTPAFVVVGGDYTSSAVSLLAADGTVLVDSWIDSGTTAPGLVTTLSGDVATASGSVMGTLGLLDRLGADVFSAWCWDGSLVGQLRVRSSESGFSPNPYDAVVVGDVGWISRNDTNPDGSAVELDRGGDLLGFDPTSMTPNGRRIDLSAFEGMTESGVAVSARPSTLATDGGRVFVVVGRTPTDYAALDAGDSAFLSIDSTSGEVEALELEGLRNCSLAGRSPGDELRFVISCLGWSSMFFGGPDTFETSGIVEVAIDGAGMPSIGRTWRPESDDPLSVQNVVVLDANRVVASAFGDFGGPIFDRYFVIDLRTGDAALVFEATESFSIGQGALVGNTLLVPDASESVRAVRRFTVGDALTEGEPIEVGPATLPPRLISAL